jgi:hypothetical protein
LPSQFNTPLTSWTPLLRRVKRPELLWDCWGPSRSLDQYSGVDALWTAFKDGEIINEEGRQIARPPLERIEQQFRARWRNTSEVRIITFLNMNSNIDTACLKHRKAWSRLKEIPDFIQSSSVQNNFLPEDIIKQLEGRRVASSKGKCVQRV